MKVSKLHIAIVIVTVLVALVVINFLASRHHARLDLTERSLYTLSPSTKKILGELNDVVTVRVYFSADLPPALMPMKRGVDDMLSEFKSAAGNKIQIEYVNPAETVLDEQRALRLGIVPIQVNVIERDRQEVAKVYMGVVVLHGDRMEVIPAVQGMANLEYQLALAVMKVSSDQEISIGWWGRDVEKELGGGYRGIMAILEQRYVVKRVADENLLDVDAAKLRALVIVSPDKLSGEAFSAIDEYLTKGGKVIALVDRWDIGEDMTAKPKETNLVDLLERYGVIVEDNLVLDKSNAVASFAGAMVTYHLPYPYWPLVRSEDLSKEDPITAELSSLVLPWTSSIELSEDVSADAEVLVRTTDFATVSKELDQKLDPEGANRLLEGAAALGSYPLAVRVGGLVVVGSSRFAQDYFLRQFSNNIAFIENAVDALVMGDELIGIRSRVGVDRPLAMMSDATMTALRTMNVLVGSVIVIVIGVVVFLMRRWRKS